MQPTFLIVFFALKTICYYTRSKTSLACLFGRLSSSVTQILPRLAEKLIVQKWLLPAINHQTRWVYFNYSHLLPSLFIRKPFSFISPIVRWRCRIDHRWRSTRNSYKSFVKSLPNLQFEKSFSLTKIQPITTTERLVSHVLGAVSIVDCNSAWKWFVLG